MSQDVKDNKISALILMKKCEAAVPCWQACWSPCCGRCHESLAGWWRSQTACPSYWPLCICSVDGNTQEKIIFRVICVYLNCTKFPGVKIKWLTFLDDTYLWGQSAHSLGVQDLRSVLDRHVVALCLFILLFVFHLEGSINPLIWSITLFIKTCRMSKGRDGETHNAGHFVIFQSQEG